MAGKSCVVVLLVAMLLMSTEHSMAQQRDPICAALCTLQCGQRPLCFVRCLRGCSTLDATTLDESHSTSVDTHVEARNRVCNVGCSLGHCSQFLFQYDNEKFGTCMSNCSENYCMGNNAVEKA